MPIDPLDIAYIAIGAKQALADCDALSDALPAFEGELGYIQACIDHAGMLERVWQESAETFPGVWCYEVAEPFGYGFGKHLLQGGMSTDAEHILRAIVGGCMEHAIT
ncbi:hypothetical protein [Pseudoxanthomonas sp.]|uniref:hypothetical protein n=1 Tax=Pseudoxanthomonas sp. TaxID=1871049 RepID=UPI0035B4B215